MLEIKLASKNEIEKINIFFKKYITEDTDGIFGHELLCPYGLKRAIIRNQVIVIKKEENIYGFLRFYPRKRDNIVSLYQFALHEEIRGMGLIKKCLEKTGYNIFETQCNIGSNFNNYYKKTGWEIYKNDENFNYFKLDLKSFI